MAKGTYQSTLYMDVALAVQDEHGVRLREFVRQRIEAGRSLSAIARELSEVSERRVHRQRLYDWRAKLGLDFRTVRTCIELRPVRRVGRPTNAEAQQMERFEPQATGTEG